MKDACGVADFHALTFQQGHWKQCNKSGKVILEIFQDEASKTNIIWGMEILVKQARVYTSTVVAFRCKPEF